MGLRYRRSARPDIYRSNELMSRDVSNRKGFKSNGYLNHEFTNIIISKK